MAIRTLDPSISIPSLDNLAPAVQWHTLNCELITPMYGGGVISTKVDEKMPIRASAIRGQLRFWWRLLAKHKWNLGNDKTIRQAEFKLWGGMNDGDADGQAGQVLLKISEIRNLRIEPWAVFNKKKGSDDYKTLPDPKEWANIPYALFPAQGKRPDRPRAENPHSLAREGLTWKLQIAFLPSIEQLRDKQSESEQPSPEEQVWESIRWWANFGGVGARTRRGLGAVLVQHEKISILSLEDITNVQGVVFVTQETQYSKPYQAWKESIDKLQSFRQVNIGRRTNSNRSLWSEPDAIRNITSQSSYRHRQRTVNSDYFPRAGFGLPIIFKFKDDGDDVNDEPAQTSLQPKVQGNVMERMASPLILGPFFNGQEWVASALLLPHDYLEDLQLSLKQSSRERSYDVEYWNTSEATKIEPIHRFNAEDPLQAFLTYFAK